MTDILTKIPLNFRNKTISNEYDEATFIILRSLMNYALIYNTVVEVLGLIILIFS
jgi:hypothetical protein